MSLFCSFVDQLMCFLPQSQRLMDAIISRTGTMDVHGRMICYNHLGAVFNVLWSNKAEALGHARQLATRDHYNIKEMRFH